MAEAADCLSVPTPARLCVSASFLRFLFLSRELSDSAINFCFLSVSKALLHCSESVGRISWKSFSLSVVLLWILLFLSADLLVPDRLVTSISTWCILLNRYEFFQKKNYTIYVGMLWFIGLDPTSGLTDESLRNIASPTHNEISDETRNIILVNCLGTGVKSKHKTQGINQNKFW